MYSSVTRVFRGLSTGIIATLAIASSPPAAQADWCETKPGSGIFTNQGCDNPQDYEVRQGGRKPAATAPEKPKGESLRERLRRAMKERDAQAAQADKITERITEAQNRAKDALRRGTEAADPDARAKARTDFYKAMKDLTKAYADADALISPERKAEWQKIKQDAIADLRKQSVQAFGTSTAAAAPQANRPAPNPDVFEHCEKDATRHGILTCYQAPRRGLSCTMVHKQGDDVVWSDQQQPCRDTRILEMRNDYFNRLEAANRQSAAVASLSAKCRRELNALLDGARRSDGGKAQAAYAALRAECDEGIRKLARDANARLPERRLSARASGALARAMSQDVGSPPRANTGSSGDGGSGGMQEAYNVDEVISLGLDLLALLNGVARMQPTRTAPSVAAPSATQPRSTYGQGAPAYQAPRTRPSDLTGTK